MTWNKFPGNDKIDKMAHNSSGDSSVLMAPTHISAGKIHEENINYGSTWMFCLCWGLTSQSTIFQSCRDGATASWVINQYFRGVKCLAQGHNTAAVGTEPPTSRSGVWHSTTESPRSPPPECVTQLSSMAPFTKPIWSGPNPYWTMVRTKFGYVNSTKNLVRTYVRTCSCAWTTVQ